MNSRVVVWIIGIIAIASAVGIIAYKQVNQRNSAAPTPPPSAAQTTTTQSTGTKATAKIATITNPAHPGGYVSLVAEAVPNSQCTISVHYQPGTSTPSSLGQKVANGNGQVSWSWVVDKNAQAGSWPLGLTCTISGTTATANGNLVVTTSLP